MILLPRRTSKPDLRRAWCMRLSVFWWLSWLGLLLIGVLPCLAQGPSLSAHDDSGANSLSENADQPSLGLRLGPTATFTGLSGLIRVPTAELVGDGQMGLTWTLPPSDKQSLSIGGASTYAVTVGMIPRSEIAISLGEEEYGRDLAAHAKVLLRCESGRSPALALGVADLSRNVPSADPTVFLVGSKHLSGDKLSLTLGAAAGGNFGLLAGASYRPHPRVELQAEYDTDRLNVGLTGRIGKNLWARAADVDVGTALTVGYQFSLDYPPRRAHQPQVLGPADLSAWAAAEALQDKLVALGLEDVQVSMEENDAGR